MKFERLMYMNELKKCEEQTITTVEIAKMMEMRHDRVLRKLEGQDVKGKHTEGIIEILTRHNLGASDYFIPATYKDESGKENKCYKITKLGCDFLANKFSGEKGIIFTARYVKRFADMEKCIKEQQMTCIVQIPKISQSRRVLQKKVERIAGRQEMAPKKVMGEIMQKLGERNNLAIAKQLYYKQYGFMPPYALDLVEFSPELIEEAHEFADEMLLKPTKEEQMREEIESVIANW